MCLQQLLVSRSCSHTFVNHALPHAVSGDDDPAGRGALPALAPVQVGRPHRLPVGCPLLQRSRLCAAPLLEQIYQPARQKHRKRYVWLRFSRLHICMDAPRLQVDMFARRG